MSPPTYSRLTPCLRIVWAVRLSIWSSQAITAGSGVMVISVFSPEVLPRLEHIYDTRLTRRARHGRPPHVRVERRSEHAGRDGGIPVDDRLGGFFIGSLEDRDTPR